MNFNFQLRKTKFLYSVNSYLAYYINENFYRGVHYVWCSPMFDNRSNPPSSNPIEIYRSLYEDVRRGDKHSNKISENKIGIRKGVKIMHDNGVISDRQKTEIIDLIKRSDTNLFTPLIYIIEPNAIAHRVIQVPIKERANILSQEIKICDLHSDEFDCICIDL